MIVVDDHGTKPAKDALADITDRRLRVLPTAGLAARQARATSASHRPKRSSSCLPTTTICSHPATSAMWSNWRKPPVTAFARLIAFSTPPSQTPAFHPQLKPATRHLAISQTTRRAWAAVSGFTAATSISVGGINPALRVNEDTDFSIRLLAAKLTGIFETGTGVLIRQHLAAGADGNLGQITKRANAADARRLLCRNHRRSMRPTSPNAPHAKRYLTKRLGQNVRQSRANSRGLNGLPHRLSLLGYFASIPHDLRHRAC